MRASHLLAVFAVALILALAGCGGGGGGGGGGTVIGATADVNGRVVDAAGNGIDGAIVEADVSRAIVSTTTAGGGYYILQDMPTQTNFNLTIRANGTTLNYNNVQVGTGTGGQAPLDIVFTTDTPPAPPGGGNPTISIMPADSVIYAGTTPEYRVQVDLGGDVFFDGYPACWTVSGAAGQISDGGVSFTVSPGAVGTTVKLRAMVRLENGQLLSTERSLPVTNPDGDDGDGPPAPPGP